MQRPTGTTLVRIEAALLAPLRREVAFVAFWASRLGRLVVGERGCALLTRCLHLLRLHLASLRTNVASHLTHVRRIMRSRSFQLAAMFLLSLTALLMGD